jgi:DNA-directed RNA polymerase subunit beta
MGDEDDDLLRAAEELGIDLSGVRSGDGGGDDEAADQPEDAEAEEGDEAVAEDADAGDDAIMEGDAPIGDVLSADDD